MTLAEAQKPQWDRIDTVLLDLDGTLLDLAFDNRFWLDRVPAAYAAARGLSLDEARAALSPMFRARQGTLDWYCIDFWGRELGLDIADLHEQERDQVSWLPGAQDFLSRVQAMGKRLVLLTNSHPEVLRIKDGRTGVKAYFDAVFSSHEFRAPKEDARFWQAVRGVERFERARSMFVDDSLPVLRAARAAGVRWIYAVQPPGDGEFPAVASVGEL